MCTVRYLKQDDKQQNSFVDLTWGLHKIYDSIFKTKGLLRWQRLEISENFRADILDATGKKEKDEMDFWTHWPKPVLFAITDSHVESCGTHLESEQLQVELVTCVDSNLNF